MRIRSPTMPERLHLPTRGQATPQRRLSSDPLLLLWGLAPAGTYCAFARSVCPCHGLAALGALGHSLECARQNRLSLKGSGARVQVMIIVAYPYPPARLHMPRQQSGAEYGLVRTRRS